MKNLFLAVLLITALLPSCVNQPLIIAPEKSSVIIDLAAKEVRRYNRILTGTDPIISSNISDIKNCKEILILSKINKELIAQLGLSPGFTDSVQNLGNEGFALKSIISSKNKILLITGNTDLGVLYGAYQYAEELDVRFYAHGDVIPDETRQFSIPDTTIFSSPLFQTRGLQPFHDFPEGPDWWNSDDYKSIFTQMVKMKMNFFGLHTYPQGFAGPEPTVWIGLPKDIGDNGSVNYSYPARYFTTTGDTPWGYNLLKTGDYFYGCGNLFETDFFGSEIMSGFTPHGPVADGHGFDPEYEWLIEPKLQIQDNQWNDLFNRTGLFYKNVFSFGRELGIKMCVGTETPLVIPRKVIARIRETGTDTTERALRHTIYEGLFERIKQAYPIDYYWFWTPEDWTWSGNNQKNIEQTKMDLESALAAAEKVKVPFTLATCGWVLGPAQDRAMFDRFLPKSWAMSCINREVGFSPVEPGFAKVNDRPKWAIPWLEDDPGLILPQLWAGRMRRDAADALAYGCTGLIGIHWRTQILSANISALAKAGWDQKSWNPSEGIKLSPDEAILNSKKPTRDLPVTDFYIDWATAQFGKTVASKAAAIFEKLDGTNPASAVTLIPRPGEWSGPGGIKPDTITWDKRQADYQFVDEFEKLGELVTGTGNIDRFNYWLSSFKYLRATGKFACSAGEINRIILKIKKDKQNINNESVNSFIAIRSRQIQEFREALFWLVKSINTTGELGTMANWQQHNYARYLYIPGKEFEKATKTILPESCWPSDSILNINRIIVPTVRTTLHTGEDLNLKVIIPGTNVTDPKIFWKLSGKNSYKRIDLVNIGRSVWAVRIPSNEIKDDFEYYIESNSSIGMLVFPATAPARNQTVVIY